MKAKNKLIWILFTLSAVLVAISIFSVITRPINLQEYDVSFNVSRDVLGFDLNTTALTFGKIFPEGSSTRNILFENKRDKEMKIQILASKNIVNFLDFQPEYTIPAKGNVTIPITVKIPANAEEGGFNGKIRIVEKR
jgi:hypothetical protein